MSDKLSVCFEWDFHIEEFSENPDLEVKSITSNYKRDQVLDPKDIEGSKVLCTSGTPLITDEVFEESDDLEFIIRLGAGFDNVDIDASTDHGVVLTHLPQGVTEGVAQVALGLLIDCANNVTSYDRSFRKSGWEARWKFSGSRIRNSTVGVAGFGLIGKRFVELLKPFNATIKAYDPYASKQRAEKLGVELVGFDKLLKVSDFVSLHVPLTDETRGMMGTEEFKKMKDSAYLINTSRGGVYRDDELAQAIRSGWIAGVATDVFENETDTTQNPLFELSENESLRCIFTPHCIAATKDGDELMLEYIWDIIDNIAHGEIPPNVLNPEVYNEAIPDEKLSPSYQP